MIPKSLLLFLFAVVGLQATEPAMVKWHPGHYVFILGRPLTADVLTLPHFRGVQKVYTWRSLEPQQGRFDFSRLRADLELARQHGRQLVVQLTHKSFSKGQRSVPDYLQGPEFGGGVYVTVNEAYNPVLWNEQVRARFKALVVALGREFDQHPNLEAVNLPETAPNARLDEVPQPGVEAYTEAVYFAALKDMMFTLRQAFPHTVVIQYTNFPVKLLDAMTDYEKEIGVGMGGPDVYPRMDSLSDPKTGVYRLYQKLAGTVPMGAAVQVSNYTVALRKRGSLAHGHNTMNGQPIVITPEDEQLIPVRDHLVLAQQKLKLNYLFWSDQIPEAFANVQKLLAEPDLAHDPAGGLETKLPPKAFLH